MNDQLFDQRSRQLGAAVTRRQFLQAVASFFAASMLPRLGSRVMSAMPAEPVSECEDCTFIPDTGVCTPDLEKVSRQGYVPITNGCGPVGSLSAYIIPDSYFGIDISPACDAHDACYGSCSTPKSVCDDRILTDIQTLCSGELGPFSLRRYTCYAIAANAYKAAVSHFGHDAWVDGQQEGCQCCLPGRCCCEGCSQCVDRACVAGCPDGQTCCDGECSSFWCGGCGVLCGDGQICCNGECVDDCGGCGACGAGQECQGGECVPQCPPCSEWDSENGGCVNKCKDGQQCCNGTCWEFGCCDDGGGGKLCCPPNCSCCGPAVGGGCQSDCTGSGEPCSATCG